MAITEKVRTADGLLTKVKTAVRRTDTTAFDEELTDLINAACADLGIAGVLEDDEKPTAETDDALIIRAVCTYCKLNFGETDEYDHLKDSYDEQKAQLQMSSDYSDFSMIEEA